MKKLLQVLGLTFLALAVILLALSVPPRASFACIILAVIAMAVLRAIVAAKRSSQVDQLDEQMDRIAATEIPSPHPRVAAVRLGGDNGVVLTPAFGFKLDPGLDRSRRQPKVQELLALDKFIDRENHPEFFGSLSRDRHLSVVR